MEEDLRDFDVAVTFAGEDREFVESVVRGIKDAGFTVFYDEDNPAELWGEELTEYFPDVYENRSRFALMFISKYYLAKPWARLERRSVLARALEQGSPYLLPVRLDSTVLPGVRSTIGYLDGVRETPLGIVEAMTRKLGAPSSSGERLFNGRTPRTKSELGILLGERPTGWEYLAFAYYLNEDFEREKSSYEDHILGFALPGSFVADSLILELQLQELARIQHLTRTFERLLTGPAFSDAMGLPGEPGDPELIERLAKRMSDIYSTLIAWANRQRSVATPSDEGEEMLRALADYANQPIEAMRTFVGDLVMYMDEVTERVSTGQDVSIPMTIKFEVPEAVRGQLSTAQEAFRAYRIHESGD